MKNRNKIGKNRVSSKRGEKKWIGGTEALQEQPKRANSKKVLFLSLSSSAAVAVRAASRADPSKAALLSSPKRRSPRSPLTCTFDGQSSPNYQFVADLRSILSNDAAAPR